MSDVFKTQSLLTIILETNYSGLASADVKKILYTKPNRTTGYFTATVDGTRLKYIVQAGDIDQSGEWKFQAYIEVSGRTGYGDEVKQEFKTPII